MRGHLRVGFLDVAAEGFGVGGHVEQGIQDGHPLPRVQQLVAVCLQYKRNCILMGHFTESFSLILYEV